MLVEHATQRRQTRVRGDSDVLQPAIGCPSAVGDEHAAGAARVSLDELLDWLA